jgi:hypothetical protein
MRRSRRRSHTTALRGVRGAGWAAHHCLAGGTLESCVGSGDGHGGGSDQSEEGEELHLE